VAAGRPPEDGLGLERVGLQLIAHLYNTSAALHGGANEAVYTQKDQDPRVRAVRVLDIERGMQPDIAAHPWQSDTCTSGWFDNLVQAYKPPEQIIGMLVNIVRKNGNLLLNVPLRPDGTLEQLARWTEVNGEGIHATRPWRLAGEGPSRRQESGSFKEAAVAWTRRDYRFAAKGSAPYVFQMQWPDDGKLSVECLGQDSGVRVSAVDLLGHHGKVAFAQQERALLVELPAARPCQFAQCCRVQLA
jgi:alpha-L-fucosidase